MNNDIDSMAMPDVFTVADLQKVLQIGRSVAYQLIKTNQIKYIRIGRSIRIPRAFVMEFMEANSFTVEDSPKTCYDNDVTHSDTGLPGERSVT